MLLKQHTGLSKQKQNNFSLALEWEWDLFVCQMDWLIDRLTDQMTGQWLWLCKPYDFAFADVALICWHPSSGIGQDRKAAKSQAAELQRAEESGRQTLPPQTVCRIPGNSPFDLLTIITHIRWPLIFRCCRAIRINISASQLDFRLPFRCLYLSPPFATGREIKSFGKGSGPHFYGAINNHQKESQ